jgi:TatD DNase family protein
MIEIIDAHCHLDFENFKNDREEVIRRAKAAGVIAVVNSGYDYYSNYRTLQIASDYVFPTLGFSPNRIGKSSVEHVIEQIRENEKLVVGVGEVGLDVVKNSIPLSKQKEVFELFISLAEELQKPLIIHARGAEEDAFRMISGRDIEAVFHCYSGNSRLMKAIEDTGYYISLSTLICFSGKHKELAKRVDLDKLLLETDSPFLSPFRGRNEPTYVIEALRVVSDLQGIEEEELSSVILENTQKIFKLEL